MSFWTFMYVIGAGVAFIIAIILSEPLEERATKAEMFAIILFVSFLSWAVPICWIAGYVIFRRNETK